MRIFLDTLVIDAEPKFTADGYLVTAPKIARVGLQDYLAGELGLKGDPMRVLKVLRPEAEVFSADSMASLAHMPATLNHPTQMVDAKNWRQLVRGMTGGDVARDGDFIRVPLALMDAEAIEQVKSGKVELSVGYTADLDFTPGTLTDGTRYDAVQRNIRGNHLAIVDRARGGKELRVIDSNPTKHNEDKPMKTIIVDGISITVADDTAESVIRKFMGDTTATIATLKQQLADAQTKQAAAETSVATLTATNATLSQQVKDAAMTPAKMDAAVAARQVVVDAARKVLPAVVVDNKTDAEIRRQVVDAKLGEASKGWSDEMVSASFGTLTVGIQTTDSVRHLHIVQSGQHGNQGASDAAYKQMCTDLAGAHKAGNGK